MIVLTAKIYISTKDAIQIDLDYSNLTNIGRSVKDRSDLQLPSFGIISNSDSFSFVDSTGEIKKYAEQGFLKKGQKVEIFISNTAIEGKEEKIASLVTGEWRYDGSEKIANVEIKDNLEELQNINITGFSYSFTSKRHLNFEWLYEYIFYDTPKKFNFLPFKDLDETTKKIFSNSYIKYPMLEKGTLWQAWEKFAVATQSQIFQDNGITKCRYVGGN